MRNVALYFMFRPRMFSSLHPCQVFESRLRKSFNIPAATLATDKALNVSRLLQFSWDSSLLQRFSKIIRKWLLCRFSSFHMLFYTFRQSALGSCRMYWTVIADLFRISCSILPRWSVRLKLVPFRFHFFSSPVALRTILSFVQVQIRLKKNAILIVV